MRILPYLLFFSSSIAVIAASSSSIAGVQIEYTTTIGGVTTSVPYQEFYGYDGSLDYGFSNSILVSGPSGSYSYSNGVIRVPAYSMETRLTFIGENSGTYESYDIYAEGDLVLVDSGTFAVVTPSLEEKVDWQHTETFDNPLSNDYWQVWQRSVDSLVYDDGELSFIFGSSSQDSYSDTEIPYARKLPMDENWQVVLDDIHVAPSLVNFGVGLELGSLELDCELSFQNYGTGRQFAVSIDQQLASGDSEYASAYVSANEDARILTGGNVRIVHLASNRDLIFEYQLDEASSWSELARLNLATGSFQGQYNSSGGNFTGGLISARDHRMKVEIEAEAGIATQIADLEIAGIEIGSYTLPTPPASPESLLGYKLVGQFTEGSYTYRHDFFFTGTATLRGHYFVESNDPSFTDDWSDETYTYQKTGAQTGILLITNSAGETTDVALTFDSATTGEAIANGRNGIRPNSASGSFTFVEYESSDLPNAPPASLTGKSFILTPDTGELKSVPDQVSFTADTISFGFSGNLLESASYSYSDGTVIYDTEEVIEFTFTSATGGTYEEGVLDVFSGTFYAEKSGTFKESRFSLSLQTNWERSETMNRALSTKYWQVCATSGDSVANNEGELNFIFDSGSNPDPINGYYEDQEIEISYAGALPLDEDWEILIDDTYVSDSVEQFTIGYQLELEGSFDCEFGFRNIGSGREVYFNAYDGSDIFLSASGREPLRDPAGTLDSSAYRAKDYILLSDLHNGYSDHFNHNFTNEVSPNITDDQRAFEYISLSQPFTSDRSILQLNDIIESNIIGSDTIGSDIIGPYNYGPVVFTTDDPLIQNGLNFRILHLAISRELVYSYQPDGVSDWTELARVNLSTGAATGLSGSGTLTGQLPSGSENLFFAVDVDNFSTKAIPIENIEIGGIEIAKIKKSTLKIQVSLAQGIIADSDADATVSIDGEPYAVSLVRGKGTLQVAMPIGSTYTVSASLGEALTSGDPRSVLLNRAATVSLVLDGDSDEDGLPDSLEARYKGKADNPDTDGDGIPDGAEVNTYRTRVDVADTDKDGLDDYEEINTTFTNPLKADSDGDRMSDYAELQAGTDPTDKSVYPAYLKVQVSLAQGIIADSDGDATVSIDGEPYAVSLVRGKGTLQVAMPIGSTYTVSASLGEALTSGDPRSVLLNRAATVSLVLDGDSDEDGLPDSLEARYKGKADNPDTDGDGIPDGAEVNTYRTRVDVADTDKDGLDDYEEINTTFTNPLKADSDGDRMSDYAELQAGTDPTDKSVYPAYLKVQVSLAQGIIADSDGDATVSIDGEPYAVSLVRGKGTLQVAMPIGSTYTVSASLGEALTSGDPRSVLLNRAATVSLVLDGDSDEDGLPDSLEARYKGKADNPDTDGDGIPDGAEVNTYRTRVDVADTDKDGLDDYEEINTTFTNPLKADSDGDRMSDYAELQAGTDPTDKSVYPAYLKVQVSLAQGIIADSDGDATVSIDGEPYAVSLVRGKGTLQVAMPIGSTYTVSASLGEALTSGDPRSVLLNRAATVSLVLDGDSDEDGLPDSLEARYKGKADNPDTDGDGIPDGAEVNTYGTRVDVADTDKDGFTDKQELDLNTNPLSSKDKPEAYIQRPVLVDLNLTYESANGYIVEKWDTAEMAYFLSSAVKDPQQGASIYLKYSLDGSNLKWIVRANSVDIDVSSLMRPIKVSKPAQLDGEVLSSINPLTGDYSVTQMFSLAISAGRTKSLSLVVSGESSFSAVGPNVSGLELDLATSSDYKALGMLKDPSRSNGPILIEGTLTMGDELANVLGQIIGSVETK